jgi:hypothetical protein
MNQALYAHMNNKRKMKKKRIGLLTNHTESTGHHKVRMLLDHYVCSYHIQDDQHSIDRT